MDIDFASEAMRRVVDEHPPLDIIAHGLLFGEGPVWNHRTQELFWVEIIGNRIWKWKAGVGQQSVMAPSGHANGMTFDRQGRLNVAGWCNRSVFRFEADGSIATLATHYDGSKLNSPNDIVVKSDGSIWWTDSAGGLSIPGMVSDDLQRYQKVQGVYRLSPGGEVQLAIADCTYPNGLVFSPDEKTLYVNDTRLVLIRAFDVHDDGSLGPPRIFHRLTGTQAGVADGMKCDVEGNVYCTGPGGVHVISPAGELLGRLRIPGHCTNMGWGDEDWRSLYVTTYDKVYRTRVKIPGVAVW